MANQDSVERFRCLINRWVSRCLLRSQPEVQANEDAANHLATSLPSGMFEIMYDKDRRKSIF